MTEPRPHRPAARRPRRRPGSCGPKCAPAGSTVTRWTPCCAPRVTAPRLAGRGPPGLTAREVEVLGLWPADRRTEQIAQHLVVSPKTVSNHVEHVYAKLGVSSRAAATLYATQQGLLGSYEPG